MYYLIGLIFLLGKIYAFELSICAIFQNEAPYMKEWIEYHRLLGVEHFYLYNDRSTDNYSKVLAPYIENKIVELFECPASNGERHFYNQRRAYVRGLNAAKAENQWVAFIDLDEFIVPKHQNTIPLMLENYKEYLGVAIHWQKFGTSGYWELPKDRFMIECLIQASPVDDEDNQITKSIVQPKRLPDCFFDEQYVVDHGIDLVHFCLWETYDGKKARNKGLLCYNGNTQYSISLIEAQINHYWCRDERYYREEKIPRKARLHQEDFAIINSWSEEKISKILALYNSRTDTTIQRFIPQLAKRCAK